jgi:hypothetical protein
MSAIIPAPQPRILPFSVQDADKNERFRVEDIGGGRVDLIAPGNGCKIGFWGDRVRFDGTRPTFHTGGFDNPPMALQAECPGAGAQVWVDETANRVASTWYKNTTGYPMEMMIGLGQYGTILLSEDDGATSGTFNNQGSGFGSHTAFTLPAGMSVSATVISRWWELK